MKRPPIVSACTRPALGVAEAAILPYLITSLEDDAPEMRWAAAYALGKLGDQRAVEPLRKALYDDQDKVRREAVKSLAQLKAVEPLIGVLRDEESTVRTGYCDALGHLGDARAVQPLIECLKDSSELVRQAAAEALGEIGDPRAIEPLKARLATEQDNWTKNRIKSALRRLEK